MLHKEGFFGASKGEQRFVFNWSDGNYFCHLFLAFGYFVIFVGGLLGGVVRLRECFSDVNAEGVAQVFFFGGGGRFWG